MCARPTLPRQPRPMQDARGRRVPLEPVDAARLRLNPIALALLALMPMSAQAQVPIVRPAVPMPTAVPVPAASWRVNGTGGAWTTAPNTRGGIDGVVDQTSTRAVYHWQSFDIGSQSGVTFNLPNAQGSALNRVVGAAGVAPAPSQIFGRLTSTVPGANGQRVTGGELLLINQNGILFGAGAQVNTGGLIASTLDAGDQDFLGGFAGSINGNTSTFRYGGEVGLFTDERNFVRVDAGAQITTAAGGRVFLFAKNVQNAGAITTPGGQTVLAGGDEVFLNSPSVEAVYASEVNPSIPALRGLLVEVGAQAGQVTNSGSIAVPRGNATLVGLAVNQQGRISATTSVSENGSVFLLARGAATILPGANDSFTKRATQGGALVLGEGSRVEITPDAAPLASGQPATSTDSSGFTTSRIELAGQTIDMQRGAQIVAPGARVNAQALDTPDYTPNLAIVNAYGGIAPSATARITVADGAVIDTSGTTDTSISVARNFVTTEVLGANDLRDAPLQRDGPLYRNRATFDLRRAVPILGDTSAYTNNLVRTVNERLAGGGSVNLLTTGGVVTHEGSRIDVSGGRVTYTEANVQPSVLIAADGTRYSLNDAPRDIPYTAIEGRGTGAQDRWGVVAQWVPVRARTEAGYVEGRSAGSVNVLGRQVVLDGQLAARATVGERQTSGADALPAAGSLEIGRRRSGDFSFGGPGFGTAGLGDFDLTAQPGSLGDGYWARPDLSALPATGRIAAAAIRDAAFGSITITANGSIEQQPGADLRLPERATLRLGAAGAAGITLGADVRSTGGSLIAQTANLDGNGEVRAGALTVASDAALDMGGNWVNRRLDGAQARAAVAGGSVQLLAAYGLDVKDGSVIDVSGGATVAASGTVGGTAAGRVVLESNRAVSSGTDVLGALHVGAELRGYGLTQGGSLRVRAAAVDVVDGQGGIRDGATPGSLVLPTAAFTQGGFTRYEVEGGARLDVAPGTTLAPQATQWQADANSRNVPTGAAPSASLVRAMLTDDLRAPTSVALAASGLLIDAALPDGNLRLPGDSRISTDPGASVTLTANTVLDIEGSVRAPGGQVALTLTGRGTSDGTARDNGYVGQFNLGTGAVIDVSGTSVLAPSANALRQGRVVDAGSVVAEVDSLFAGRQTALNIEPGAVLRADAARDAFDLSVLTPSGVQTQRQDVAGAAGSLRISAADGGARVAGILSARAARADTAGGSLVVETPSTRSTIAAPDEYLLQVQAGALPQTPAARGAVAISADTVNAGGFADARLASQDRIDFAGSATLAVGRSLELRAPVLSAATDAAVALAAPTSVRLSAPIAAAPATNASTAGNATLDVRSGLVTLAGDQTTQGLGRIDLQAGSRIQLESATSVGTSTPGALRTAADVNLAAPQTVVATAADYTVDAPGHRVTFTGGDASAAVPIVGGGALTVNAATIVQDGVVRAPLGRISLNASDSITLSERSLTSVSGAGSSVPFGATASGRDWTYLDRAITAEPDKAIALIAPGRSVDVRAGAVLDMSGSGELRAYEFVPGPGGSRDAFAGAAGGSFAVVPTVRDYGPNDAAIAALVDASGATGSVPTGRTIRFGEGAPLPAGTYAVLPARYALQPGAFLVTPAGTAQVAPGVAQVRVDGAVLIGAQLGSTGTLVAEAPRGFIVRTAEQAAQLSEIRSTSGDTLLAAAAIRNDGTLGRLAQDAGSLDISAGQLSLAGSARFDLPTPATTGVDRVPRGGAVAIVAERIEVNETAGSDPTTLYLTPGQLNATGASSLTLGALRGAVEGTGINAARALQVGARQIVLANEAEALRADDVVLAATERVALDAGAQITAGGTASASRATTAEALSVRGDGALLRASADGLATAVRSETTRAAGELVLGAGARVRGESLTAEATLRTAIDPTAQLDASNYTIGASRIAIGEAASTLAGPDALVVSAGLAQRLSGAQQATLRSFSSIDFSGAASLGGIAQRALTLDAGSLQLVGADADVQVQAGGVRLVNTSGAIAQATEGTGRLAVRATGQSGGDGDLRIGAGTVVTAGVGRSELQAQRSVVFDGSTSLATAGDVAITAARVSGTQRADAQLSATGSVQIARGAALASDAPLAAAGASLAVTAARIVQGGLIDLPSGTLSLQARGATGTAAADEPSILLAAGSSTQLAGRGYSFDGQAVSTGGGSFVASAAAGSIVAASGSRIDVSAGPTVERGGSQAAAGRVDLQASAGRIELGGALVGQAASGAGGGGELRLESAQAVDLAQLGRTLAASAATGRSNFGGSISARNREGDQRLAADARLAAESLSIASDAGALSVAGSLDASGVQGGQIRLAARDNLDLQAGAQLRAQATGPDHDGGTVNLMTSAGRIGLAAGSNIDTGGTRTGAEAAASNGQVLLRAPRLGAAGTPVTTADAGSEVAVDAIGSTLTGVRRVEVEAVKNYAATAVNTTLINTVTANNTAFAGVGGAQSQAIAGRLAAGNASLTPADVHVRSGVEIRSTGNLTVTGDTAAGGWNLTPFNASGIAARPGGEPMNLSLRAAGNLLLQASLSDGFRAGGTTAPTTAAAAARIVPEATIVGEGSSLRLIGGADLSAADVLATLRSEDRGDVVIGRTTGDTLVRTTTGNIDIAAGRDVRLLNRQSVVYSTGTPVPSAGLAGYVVPTSTTARIASGTQRQDALLAHGGSVSVDAGRDVVGATNGPTQYGVDWYWRSITGDTASWYSRYDRFRQGFGTFGGGDVSVHAGRDLLQVQAAVADAGYFARDPLGVQRVTSFEAGNLSYSADRDVNGGFVFGTGERVSVQAGLDISSDAPNTALQAAVGNTVLAIAAQRDLAVGRVSHPLLSGPTSQGGPIASYARRLTGLTGDARFEVTSDAGSVTYSGEGPNISGISDITPARASMVAPEGALTVAQVQQSPSTAPRLLLAARDDVTTVATVYVGGVVAAQTAPTVASPADVQNITGDPFAPGREPLQRAPVGPVRIVSTEGDVQIGLAIKVAAPLRILAAGSISQPQPTGTITIAMQHVDDTDVSLLRAGRDITLTPNPVTVFNTLAVHGPGDLIIEAGRNVDLGGSGGFGALGNRDNAALPAASARLTVLAGVSPTLGDYSSAQRRYFHLLGGAGIESHAGDLAAQLDALAQNQPLPAAGSAAATAFAALSPAAQIERARSLVGDAAFDASLLRWMRSDAVDPKLDLAGARLRLGTLDARDQAALAARVLGDRWVDGVPAAAQVGTVLSLAQASTADYSTDLLAFVTARTGTRPSNVEDALARFAQLPPEVQLLHMNRVLTTEIRNAGRTASALAGDERDAAYDAAYRALATVFPDVGAGGELRMGSSQIKTLQGSGIDILTPRGGINVGELTAASSSKTANELGIVTTAGGSVTMTVRDDVAVNQSRVFTVGQGDLQIWASEGNIDAGRGAKTVTGAPPPVYRLQDGRIVVDTSSSYSGSGIAVLDSSSTLDLYAPKGEINAGDAGIKSAGNAFLGAARFVGADNLQVSGVVVGAPPAPPAAGGTAGLANAGQAATAAGNRPLNNEDEEEKRKRRARRNLLLDFLGFGSERS